MKPIINTPIEEYKVQGKTFYVKREDLCAPPPAPPFSKIRGLYKHLQKKKAEGVKVVGYCETAISMAGWGVAWACQELGLTAVIYDPQYKETPELLAHHRKMWEQFRPEIRTMPAGMAKVNYYVCRNKLKAEFGPGALMLELGIPLQETIDETAQEWRRTMEIFQPDTTVIAVGSGTICAGIIKAWKPEHGVVVGALCRSGNMERKRETILKKARRMEAGLLGEWISLMLVNPGWEYMDKSEIVCPFPCHPFYDLKAWEWLMKNDLPGKTLFWNIGKEAL